MSETNQNELWGSLAVLYELSLAVGRSLDLRTNCETFLQTLLTAKNFTFGAIWLRSALLRRGADETPKPQEAYELVAATPPCYVRERVLPADHVLVTKSSGENAFSVSAADPAFSALVTERDILGGAFAVFSLAGMGFLKVYAVQRNEPLDRVELNQLQTVMAKFAVSIEGCLAHQALMWESAERQRILEALQQSEQRYRTVVESASDGIVVIRNGLITFANRRAADMAGESAEALIGQPFTKFVHPAEMAKVLSYHRRRLAGEEAPAVYETRLHSPVRKEIGIVELTVSMVQTEGEPTFVVMIRDITDRRRLEAERERLAVALEQTADAVLITDPDARITYVNPAFEGLWGRTRLELIGQDAAFVATEEPQTLAALRKAIQGGHVWRGRIRGRRKDGAAVVCDTIVTPTRGADGQIVAAVWVQRDITRELQLEEQYLQAQKMDSVGRLAGGIAHDFNNIMTAILGFGTMILEQVGDNHVLRHAVEQIVTAGERATNLTRQLLTFSRRHMTEIRTVDLNAVIMEMLTLLRRALGEDVELVTQLDDEAGCLRGDPGLIQQVIMNLAINARDAMPRGGRLIIRTQFARLSEDFCRSRFRLKPGDYILLQVIDNGEGMTPDVLAHVFEPFFTTKPKGKGTGLGLATVYAIVEQCRGHIEIESEVSKGTTVSIWLPRLETSSDAVPVEIEDEAQQGTETILVVEDEDLVRDLTVRLLRSLGYNVLEATNGREGAAIVERLHGRVDLIFTDVIMPQMGGPEMAERLLRTYPRLKVLYTSGFSEMGITEFGKPVSADRWLAKPYTREVLARRVRDVLDKPTGENAAQGS